MRYEFLRNRWYITDGKLAYPAIMGGSDDDGDSGDDTGGGKAPENKDDEGKKDEDELSVARKEREEARKQAADLQAKIDAHEKEKRDAEKKAAEEKGEFERLYNDEKANREREAAEAKALATRQNAKLALYEYVSEKHPDYQPKSRWMLSALKEALSDDADETAISKAVKETVEAFVKDNPLQESEGGAPGSAGRSGGRNQQVDAMAKFPGLKSEFERSGILGGSK
jgi:hypothetical protein